MEAASEDLNSSFRIRKLGSQGMCVVLRVSLSTKLKWKKTTPEWVGLSFSLGWNPIAISSRFLLQELNAAPHLRRAFGNRIQLSWTKGRVGKPVGVWVVAH